MGDYLELLHLKYFQNVANTEHLTKSSEKLHVAQPCCIPLPKAVCGMWRAWKCRPRGSAPAAHRLRHASDKNRYAPNASTETTYSFIPTILLSTLKSYKNILFIAKSPQILAHLNAKL